MIAVPDWNNDALNSPEDSNTTSSIVGGINIHSTKRSNRNKMVQTSVKIPNGVYLGGDATLGGGVLAAVDTWEAEAV